MRMAVWWLTSVWRNLILEESKLSVSPFVVSAPISQKSVNLVSRLNQFTGFDAIEILFANC